jgi:glutamyl-tRNA reductase
MVLGEPQILGQVKQSVRAAESAGTLGHTLGNVFRKTFSVAKQVRTETALGGESISMAAAALRLAQNIFGDLSRTRMVLVGVGEMVELAATYFAAQRPAGVKVANRTLARGEEFAERFGGTAISLAELPEHLHEFDIVISGTASTLPILGKGMFERALKRAAGRPMFVVDFAVPRDVEPEVATLEDVFLYTIDDLGNVVSEGRERRHPQSPEAEAIVEAQLRAFREWQGTRAAAPAIVELRRRADQYREAELAKARARLAKGEDPAAVLEGLARGLGQQIPAPPVAGPFARRRRRARDARPRHRDAFPRSRGARAGRIMKPSIAAKLASLDARLKEIDARLSDPGVTSDLENYRKLSQERAEIQPSWRASPSTARPRATSRPRRTWRRTPRCARSRRTRSARARSAWRSSPRTCRRCSCRGIPTTSATSSSRSAPAPAATRARSSRATSSACTRASPSGIAGRSRSCRSRRAMRAATRK